MIFVNKHHAFHVCRANTGSKLPGAFFPFLRLSLSPPPPLLLSFSFIHTSSLRSLDAVPWFTCSSISLFVSSGLAGIVPRFSRSLSIVRRTRTSGATISTLTIFFPSVHLSLPLPHRPFISGRYRSHARVLSTSRDTPRYPESPSYNFDTLSFLGPRVSPSLSSSLTGVVGVSSHSLTTGDNPRYLVIRNHPLARFTISLFLRPLVYAAGLT